MLSASDKISDTVNVVDAVPPKPQTTVAVVVTAVSGMVLPANDLAVQRSVLLGNLAICDFSRTDELDTAGSYINTQTLPAAQHASWLVEKKTDTYGGP